MTARPRSACASYPVLRPATRWVGHIYHLAPLLGHPRIATAQAPAAHNLIERDCTRRAVHQSPPTPSWTACRSLQSWSPRRPFPNNPLSRQPSCPSDTKHDGGRGEVGRARISPCLWSPEVSDRPSPAQAHFPREPQPGGPGTPRGARVEGRAGGLGPLVGGPAPLADTAMGVAVGARNGQQRNQCWRSGASQHRRLIDRACAAIRVGNRGVCGI